jgi:hypothetical protein
MSITDLKPRQPHPKQRRAFFAPEKFVGLACGRGSGKSMLAKMRLVRGLAESTPGLANPIYFYLLPTVAQAKRVAWGDLLNLIPKQWVKDVSVSDMTITTKFGSTLYVLGGDKSERIEGVQWSGGVVDEACDYKEGVWSRSLVPALMHHCRFCWRIGVPKRFGSSATEYRQWFHAKESDRYCASWPSSDILGLDKLNEVKSQLSDADFQEQFNATWLSAMGGVYVEFSEIANVTSAAQYDRNRPIYVGSDFNVDPMSWVLAHYVNGNIVVFDEIKIRNTTTQRTLDYLYSRYSNHRAGWTFTGDAASRQRSTSSDYTDYLIINNDLRFGDKSIIYPDSNPSLATRFAVTNAALRSGDGKRHVFIHPTCLGLITDLKQQAFKPSTSDVDHRDKTIGHSSDALGYLICYLRPIDVIAKTEAVIYSGLSFELVG